MATAILAVNVCTHNPCKCKHSKFKISYNGLPVVPHEAAPEVSRGKVYVDKCAYKNSL